MASGSVMDSLFNAASRVGSPVGGLHFAGAYSRVNLRGLQAAMAKELFDLHEVRAVAQQVRGACVPPDVRRNGFFHADGFGILFDHHLDHLAFERMMRLDRREPQRPLVPAGVIVTGPHPHPADLLKNLVFSPEIKL